MIPIRDDTPSNRFPLATIVIIVLNVLAFLYELQLGPRLEPVLFGYAIVPVRYTTDIAQHFSLPEQAVPFIASMFLHGGWIHLLGNMWILWIFGDNVEERLGSGRYLALYFLSGIAAGLMHVFTNTTSELPTIGASGAVAGIMGAYFRFFPRARIDAIVPPFIWGPVFSVPAIFFLGFWFLLQFFNGVLAVASRQFGGVAWWAHVGGFLFGLGVCLLVRRPPPLPRIDSHGRESW
jgi:membrane associated rhomboid family serine protease